MIDTHCHLNTLDLSVCGGSVQGALALAKDAGVGAMICIGLRLDTAHEVLALAEAHPEIYASVGVHPNEVCDQEPTEADLIKLACHPKVVAIGECGLDVYHDMVPLSVQKKRFETHLMVAKAMNLPVVVHTRDTIDQTLDILEAHGVHCGILHCFTGSLAQAKRAIEMGLMISFSGIVTFKNAKEIQNVASMIPLTSILIETDAPYLSPHPYRGKPNHPAQVKWVAEMIAQLRNLSFEEVVKATTENANRVFGRVFLKV